MADGRLESWRGDITTLVVDAIVNAANSALAPGGGVDGAIRRAAGPGLTEETARIGGCPTGEARITGGHGLAAKQVIHAVGPVWRGGSANEDALLANCYRAALARAAEHGLDSIAFPAISTGIYGFPADRAAAIAVATIGDFLAGNDRIERVVLVSFDGAGAAVIEQALARQIGS